MLAGAQRAVDDQGRRGNGRWWFGRRRGGRDGYFGRRLKQVGRWGHLDNLKDRQRFFRCRFWGAFERAKTGQTDCGRCFAPGFLATAHANDTQAVFVKKVTDSDPVIRFGRRGDGRFIHRIEVEDRGIAFEKGIVAEQFGGGHRKPFGL